jgi:heme-degrading monooxygenase HmoA
MERKCFSETVASAPKPGKEAEYNRWYDEHIKILFGFKGLKKVSRIRCFRPIGENGGHSPQYITTYEFESKEDFDAFYQSPYMKTAEKHFKENAKNILDVFWAGAYEALITLEK